MTRKWSEVRKQPPPEEMDEPTFGQRSKTLRQIAATGYCLESTEVARYALVLEAGLEGWRDLAKSVEAERVQARAEADALAETLYDTLSYMGEDERAKLLDEGRSEEWKREQLGRLGQRYPEHELRAARLLAAHRKAAAK